MSYRYDWSRQESYQPFPTGTVPHVTESDFSYITSEDIDGPSYLPVDPRYSNQPAAATAPAYEVDDVLHLVLSGGREYQLQFPAYSIGDGKLLVRDIQVRIAFLLEIPEQRIPYISLLYKGQKLQNPEGLVRSYGCKNHSELLCLIPDRFPDQVESERAESRHRSHTPVGNSGSDTDAVVVTDEHGRVVRNTTRGRRQSSVKHSSSPRNSGTNLHVPSSNMGNFGSKRTSSHMRAGKPAMTKLAEIAEHFDTTIKPRCEEFAMSPPTNKQKRDEEHKRLEEATMQQVLLKLDEVQTDGDEEVRQTRKQLVRHVQEVLKLIDNQK